MTTPNLPIGSTNTGTNDWSDVHGEDQAIVDAYTTDHASGGHSGSWLANSSVTDAKLASPNNSVYRTLLFASAPLTQGIAAATRLLVGTGTQYAAGSMSSVNVPPLSGGNLLDTTSSYSGGQGFIYFDDADYTVGSLTQKLRVRAQVNTNATQPTITFTIGLYPVTFAGGTNLLTATLGTVVSGSTVAIASPAASSTTQGNSGDFTIPSDGQYVLGVVTSGAVTTNNASLVTAQLQTRSV